MLIMLADALARYGSLPNLRSATYVMPSLENLIDLVKWFGIDSGDACEWSLERENRQQLTANA